MAKITDPGEEEELRSHKEEGVAVVKALTEVGRQLYPLKEKVNAGKKLSKRDQTKLDRLEREYRMLENDLRTLMRPRERTPWLRGLDHTHSRPGSSVN